MVSGEVQSPSGPTDRLEHGLYHSLSTLKAHGLGLSSISQSLTTGHPQGRGTTSQVAPDNSPGEGGSWEPLASNIRVMERALRASALVSITGCPNSRHTVRERQLPERKSGHCLPKKENWTQKAKGGGGKQIFTTNDQS